MLADRGGHFEPPRNFAGLSPPYCDLATARVVVLPVPYDGTAEWHAGARHGPRAIIDASQLLELYDLELGREVHTAGIHTLPELSPVASGPEAMIGRVRKTAAQVASVGKILLMLGGEHSVTLGAVQSLKEAYPDLSVLQFDAHTDLRDEYMGSRYGNACVTRRILEVCPVVQVGARSSSLEEQQFAAQRGLRPFYAYTLQRHGRWVEEVVAMLSDTVYVNIDLDAFDPAIMSAVGTPEPGGLAWDTVLELLRAVAADKRIVGGDIMELCPGEGPAACAFLAARLAYKVVGYSLYGGGRWAPGE